MNPYNNMGIPIVPRLSNDQVEKLYTSFQLHTMAIEEHRARKEIDDFYDERKQTRLEDYRKRKAMSAVIVSQRMDGTFWYAIDVSGKPGCGKEVFPGTKNFTSTRYEARDADITILEVTFERGHETIMIRFDPYADDGIRIFEKRLRAQLVSVSVGRTLKTDVLSQVLGLLLKSANVEKLPSHHGWQQDDDGNFYFVGLDDLTLEEV